MQVNAGVFMLLAMSIATSIPLRFCLKTHQPCLTSTILQSSRAVTMEMFGNDAGPILV